ncbi:MAG: DMT family transporter [Clostridiales bacterium]|nr:DMT family transporter [Clostridiales bacterium]
MKDRKKQMFTNPYILMALALISCFLWGSAFPSIKVGYSLLSIGAGDTYEKMVFAGYRFFLSSMIILAFCLLTGRSLKLQKKAHMPRVAFLGLLQTTIQYTFFYIGLSNTSGTLGSILSASSTFFTVIIAHFFYKTDRLTFRRLAGVILGFAGVVIANMRGGGVQGGFSITGEGFVIISSLVGAMAGIYTKKISKDISPFAISGYQLFIGSIILIFIGFIGGGNNIAVTSKSFMLLLYLAFISAAAFTLWTILLKYNGVGRVSIYKFTIPLFGTLLSHIFLQEKFLGFYVITAAILVSLGILLINSAPKSKISQ